VAQKVNSVRAVGLNQIPRFSFFTDVGVKSELLAPNAPGHCIAIAAKELRLSFDGKCLGSQQVADFSYRGR
jgi:hypothetical protein